MVETVNNLLQPQALNAWKDLTTSDQLRAATMLLDTVEESAFVLADNLLKTDIVRENTDNIRKCPETLQSRKRKRKMYIWCLRYKWCFFSIEMSYYLSKISRPSPFSLTRSKIMYIKLVGTFQNGVYYPETTYT
jgi:hypothetical protein